MSAVQPLRLGMIGCGQISSRFFNQAAELEGVTFVATCAAHAESAKAKAEERGCERWTTDYLELLSWPDLDGVVVTTPHQMHAAMATDAAKAGKHVLIEKPMATRWDQAQALVAAVEASGVTAVALPYDHSPVMLTGLSFLREEIVGKITAVEAELNIPGPPRSNWYYSKEAEGGAMLDTAPYALSRIACVLGPARRVTAFTGTLIPKRLTGDGGRVQSEVDDNVTILLEYAGGQHAVMRTCWAYSYSQNGTVVHGRHGDVFMNEFGRPLVVHTTREPLAGAEPVEYLAIKGCYAPSIPKATETIVGEFVTCIRSGERPRSNVWQARHVVEQMMKAYESSRTGRTLELETTFTPWWTAPAGIFDLKSDWL
ncbi:MAG TPA: Gfo/Idh/MocA family oxidoreductase [Chloroflexota bacterium]|nr:Gfo/Idh/MocA family oxidoreductase [Chloroflexota bacterium]